MKIRIATRQSPMALWQAEYVKDHLCQLDSTLDIELIGITTEGDRKLETVLSKEGGKGLFIKELEQALLDGRADIAVHSLKDMTVDLPDGLGILAVCERHECRDAFVSHDFQNIDDLPKGATVGTSSLRRQCQLLRLRPDLIIKPLRGNVGTRLKKLEAGEFAGIILSAAGLERLGLTSLVKEYLSVEDFLPAVGQGAIGIEGAINNAPICELVSHLNHLPSQYCLTAERAMNRYLNGGCQVPIAGYAYIQDHKVCLKGLVGDPSGHEMFMAYAEGVPTEASHVGQQVATGLLAQGAKKILDKIYGAQ